MDFIPNFVWTIILIHLCPDLYAYIDYVPMWDLYIYSWINIQSVHVSHSNSHHPHLVVGLVEPPWSTPWSSPWSTPWCTPWSIPWSTPWSTLWSTPWSHSLNLCRLPSFLSPHLASLRFTSTTLGTLGREDYGMFLWVILRGSASVDARWWPRTEKRMTVLTAMATLGSSPL